MASAKSKKSSRRKTRIFLVDDHPIVRKGLIELINQELGFKVCGEAEEGSHALELIGKLMPDVALVDLSLNGMDGIELIKQLRSRFPKLPILVLSMLDESLYAERALRAGAKGYVMKHEGTEKLVSAIKRILKGEVSVSEDVSSRLVNRLANNENTAKSVVDQLSDRELEVFRLIGSGLSTRQIADKLCLSVKTVETYREHIKDKLTLKHGTELVQHAVHWIQNESLNSPK